ncbi:MAG: AIR synthase family protein [Promethearchaeia archaeon]
MNYFRAGKLNHDFLESMIKRFVADLSIQDERIINGSMIGEDAAVIDDGDKYLVAKTDPITFATDEIGYYVVNVNVNDVVCTGAIPKWFQTTILLPEKKTDDSLVEKVFRSVYNACKTFDISIIGGHTEVSTGLPRPVLVGHLLGEVEKEDLVLTSGAEPGNSLILTRGVFIEGTSIIARERSNTLVEHNFSKEFIEKCKNFLYDPGISVYEEALLANKHFNINSMHDPTEGGLYCGIAEMAMASNCGVLIDESRINIFEESKALSEIFDLNPMNTITSGALLIAIEEESSSALVNLLRERDIPASRIGKFTEKQQGLRLKKANEITQLQYTEIDEITKIFQE